MINEKEFAIKDASISANKKQQWLYIAGMSLLSIIGGLLYYQNRTRKKNNQKLTLFNKELREANQIKARFFSILNHDLRSPVSNIIKLIRLQQNTHVELDDVTQKRLQTQTVASAENLLSSMEDLLMWSKGQMENFKPQFKKTEIKDVFKDIKIFFNDVFDVEITFENPERISLETDENYLKTIMRNLTSNAVKALSNINEPKIIWKAWLDTNSYIVSITDNGRGGTNEQFSVLYDEKHVPNIQTGLGLHFIKDMVKAINGRIEVQSEKDKGTVVKIIIPIST